MLLVFKGKAININIGIIVQTSSINFLRLTNFIFNLTK